VVIMIGIPDFRKIASLFLEAAPGIEGRRFDLKNVYRYTHGEPEHATYPIAGEWRADASGAPDGWLPQLHKCLFDPSYLRDLLDESEFPRVIFRYAYPAEPHRLNLGFIAARTPLADSSVDGIRAMLARVPTIERFIDLGTIELAPALTADEDQLLAFARRLADRRPVRGVRPAVRRLWEAIRQLGWEVVARLRELGRSCLEKLSGEPS
jgi:hypothetical protein